MNGALTGSEPIDFHFTGVVRRHYISAEEITWDYAPTGFDNWLGVPFNLSPRAQAANYTEFGTKWQKAVYRGYTDSNFTTLAPQPPWQGIQGPTIRAEVGDMIEILFVNRLTNNFATLHSKGLAYGKDSEGTTYPNNTSPRQESPTGVFDAVPPGGCTVYKFFVNDANAPPPDQPSILRGYQSFVSPEEDMNSGLLGAQIIYHRGMMNATMATHREFVFQFMGYDESNAFMSEINAKAHHVNSTSTGPSLDDITGHFSGNFSIWHPQLTNLLSSGGMDMAPTFYAINGFVFANNPIFHMCLNDKVIWYVYAHGHESHVFHMHGNNFKYLGVNYATISVNDGEMITLHMDALGAGLWQVICLVSDHLTKGMVAFYQVHKGDCPLPPLAPLIGPPSNNNNTGFNSTGFNGTSRRF
ncbi:putative multicopper oxidase [Thermoascus aurantiacus ATCC 26904]